jgi:predicted nucleotidyltransferase
MMHDLLTSNLDHLRELCRKHRVKRLDVFGSAARGDDFDPERSDLDFLVEFEPHQRKGLDDVYFELRDNLEALFGRKVDLVERSAIRNPYFRTLAETARVNVYVAA